MSNHWRAPRPAQRHIRQVGDALWAAFILGCIAGGAVGFSIGMGWQ